MASYIKHDALDIHIRLGSIQRNVLELYHLHIYQNPSSADSSSNSLYCRIFDASQHSSQIMAIHITIPRRDPSLETRYRANAPLER